MQLKVENTNSVVPEVQTEQRGLRRRRVLKRGLIDFNNGYSRFSCVVKNLTDSGAMLEMGETTGMPSRVGFQMDDLKPANAEIVWRSANRIGIRFCQVQA